MCFLGEVISFLCLHLESDGKVGTSFGETTLSVVTSIYVLLKKGLPISCTVIVYLAGSNNIGFQSSMERKLTLQGSESVPFFTIIFSHFHGMIL